jgi:subtilisin family serine protease
VSRSGIPVDPDGEHLAVGPVDADIAILDTGIRDLPDLGVAGGHSCVGSDPGGWDDDNGHGTHVAGIAAAIDNDAGVVGVAPGARLWAVKVLDRSGGGTFSDVICGLDWVVENADAESIDVINLSLSGATRAGEHKNCSSSAFHRAICAVVDAGIPVVVAAGNQGTNAKTRVPAAFKEVITVSGFADLDGEPGKLGGRGCGHYDDSFLSFSNYGRAVDIAAPGGCIVSYRLGGGLEAASGTSAASPHVAGAIAHFVANSTQQPTPSQARAWLLTEASRSQAVDGVSGDPDVKKPKKDKKKNKKGKGKKDRKKDKRKKKRERKRARNGHREPVLWLDVLEAP